MKFDELKRWIKKYEGFNPTPSYNPTTGKLRIGFGRHLGNGINSEEAELMFENDFLDAMTHLMVLTWFKQIHPNAQCALINLNFNIGIAEFLDLKEMIKALEEQNYTKAAKEILESEWGMLAVNHKRAVDIATMIAPT